MSGVALHRATSAASPWRALLVPALAAAVAFALLMGLGLWQLERKTWKEDLLAQMDTRAYGEPVAIPSETDWPRWRAAADEFRRVRLSGRFEPATEIPVHGLAKPGREAIPGFFLFAPLRLEGGGTVMINRGFVPTELKSVGSRAPLPAGPVTVVGLERAPETRAAFVPANDPQRTEWFVRNLDDMNGTLGLSRVAPFYVDADSTPNPGGWPKGGQTQLTLKNDHLQYAISWFGLGASLLGVFGAFAWKRLVGDGSGGD